MCDLKQAYLILSVALLAFFAGNAAAFTMSVSEHSVSVHTGEIKVVALTISSPIDDIIVFSVPIEQPWMSIPTHLPILANETKTTDITFSPLERTQPSIYKLDLLAEAIRAREKGEQNITISVRSSQVAVEKLDVSGSLEPSGWGQITLYIKNYENSSTTALLNLSVSEFLNWSDELTLAPGEFKVIQRGFTIPECQRSGEYAVSANVYVQENHVFSANDKFVIPEKFIQTVGENVTTSGLSTKSVITIKNIGNIEGVAEYSQIIPGALFFTGDQPTSTDNAFKWILNVGACQSRVVRYTVDYTIIPEALIVIFALWYVFFRLRTVRISKRILQKAKIEKGIEFTVGIDVKSWVNAKNVEIRDFVPSLFEVRNGSGIKPTLHKSEAGTELVWGFKEFGRHEERILDYKIVPMFEINGRVMLPKANVNFSHLHQRISKSSNVAHLGLHLVEPIENAGKIADFLSKLCKKKQ